MSADYPTLCTQKGPGESKYTQIQAISELASRYSFSHLAKEGRYVILKLLVSSYTTFCHTVNVKFF